MRWTRHLVAAVTAALLCSPVAALSVTSSPAAAADTVSVPTSAHPYSDPVWSPLHTTAAISCVRTNCRTASGNAYHGNWAIDFTGKLGDPVYAAGAGVFHVGEYRPGCVSTADAIERGTWAWVDHGGGRVTRYHHLDSFVATEGQRVTPATVIGRMGHSGDLYPCTTNYLHFEIRQGGVNGTRVEPKSLAVCLPSGRATMPALFGVSSFDSLVRGARSVTVSTTACVGTPWTATPAQPVLSTRRKDRAVALSWTKPPTGATQVVLTEEVWSPSLGRYGKPVYRYLAGTTAAYTWTGLSNGRTYRFKVASKTAAGASAWSATRTAIPAGLPRAPQSPRFLTSPTRDYVHYGWWKADGNGAAVTQYRAQVRCAKPGGTYGSWREVRVGASTYYTNFRSLTGYRYCQVRVRSVNPVGLSPWSTTSTIRKAT